MGHSRDPHRIAFSTRYLPGGDKQGSKHWGKLKWVDTWMAAQKCGNNSGSLKDLVDFFRFRCRKKNWAKKDFKTLFTKISNPKAHETRTKNQNQILKILIFFQAISTSITRKKHCQIIRQTSSWWVWFVFIKGLVKTKNNSF